MKTEKADGRAYAGFGGRVYKVARAGKAGLWWAVGKRRGLRDAFLDKLGPRGDPAEMQRALDATASRLGWREVTA